MSADLSTALAAGLVVLVCAACLIADVVIEHLHHGRNRDAQAEHSHNQLMREIRRHR